MEGRSPESSPASTLQPHSFRPLSREEQAEGDDSGSVLSAFFSAASSLDADDKEEEPHPPFPVDTKQGWKLVFNKNTHELASLENENSHCVHLARFA